ncbi:MAG TPA: TetR/AcrR family transcriptional regulator [Candidatus Limnocylindrales bacterium]|nr:TetR/AcrR family transcriptional regulator [Candidatus Limnocylindrales bacterium]
MARAGNRADTRTRIIGSARELIPSADVSLPVTAIARHAGVAIQTVYDQFGSKGGLLIAVLVDIQRSLGLFDSFNHVFRSPDGEEALGRMNAATMTFWDRAWPYLEFMLRARRVDPVVAQQMGFIDRLRRAHYEAIVRQLDAEGRLAAGQSVDWATSQAFGFSTPTVYEELVVRGSGSVEAASESVTRATLAAILEPGKPVVRDHAPEWARLEAEAAARARADGADPAALSPEWRGARRSPRAD